MMLGISTLLGAFGLLALLWGHKSGQFEDHHKFIDGALYDGEEELKDAIMMEEKRKRAKEHSEKPMTEDGKVMPE